VKIPARIGNFPDFVTTARHGWGRPVPIRSVSRGLSFRTVSAPTKMASHPARIFCTSARAAAPVIHLRPGTANDPSNVIANFRITQGCWDRVQKK
jgi:hypothetical protein